MAAGNRARRDRARQPRCPPHGPPGRFPRSRGSPGISQLGRQVATHPSLPGKTAALGVFALVAALFGCVAVAQPAHAATTTAPDWAQRTCTAFAAWQEHPTSANLVTLGTDSLHVPWKYLGEDVWQLVRDVRAEGPHGKYVSDSAQYAYQDCHDGYGL